MVVEISIPMAILFPRMGIRLNDQTSLKKLSAQLINLLTYQLINLALLSDFLIRVRRLHGA